MGSLSGTNGKGKSKKSAKAGDSLTWRDYSFVDIPLFPGEVDVFKEDYAGEDVDALKFIGDWVAKDYKLSVSSDARGGGVLLSLSCRGSEDPNRGLVLTARGSTCEGALKLLIYIDMVVCGEEAWKQVSDERGGASTYII